MTVLVRREFIQYKHSRKITRIPQKQFDRKNFALMESSVTSTIDIAAMIILSCIEIVDKVM